MLKVLTAIDLANVIGQLKAVNRKPDLPALRQVLANPSEGRFELETIVYGPLPAENGDGVQRWHDWLRHQGFLVVSKRAKRMPDGKVKANMDGELILDTMELCLDLRPEVFVLVSGDGDFSALCQRIRRKGIRVEVAGLLSSMANELKASAHGFIDLTEWANRCPALGGQQAPELGTAAVLEDSIL